MGSQLILLAAVAGAIANAATYELRRITVGHNDSPVERYVARCHIKPGVAEYESWVGSLSAKRNIALEADDAAVQALVDAAAEVERPVIAKASSYTNWYVRSSPSAEFKLVRSNVTTDGKSTIVADQSKAGKQLAVFMGVNCFRSFGQ